MDINHIINTSVDDCRSAVLHATREQLIAAHRYCEASYPLNKTRKGIIASALRRQQKTTTTTKP